MTVRAVLIGFLVGLVIATFGYVNDWVFDLPYFAIDLMPVIVYGLLVVGLLLVNPVLRVVGARYFRGGEWATICCLALAACVIPGPGFLAQFHNCPVMPVAEERMRPGWQATAEHPSLLSYVPDRMLVDTGGRNSEQEETVLLGFVRGLAGREGRLPVSAVPWRAWVGPYSVYLPLVALGFVASICLVLVLHPQWAHREHLRYPIAEVASTLIGQGQAGRWPAIFRSTPFWLGFCIAAAVLLVNGVARYFPEFISIPMSLDMRIILQSWPVLSRVPDPRSLLFPHLYFAVVALGFLINSEVSFSLGISHVACAAVFLTLTGFGVDMSNSYMSGGAMSYQLFGSYVGGGLFVLYIGRQYYWDVLKRAVGAAAGESVSRQVVWACRLLIVSVAAMILLLRLLTGLDLLMSTLLVMLFGLTFLMIVRINAETGLLLVQPNWQAVAIITGLFGAHTLGPRTLIILGMMCAVMTIDPRVCLTPLVGNAFKLADGQRLRLPRLGMWMTVLLLLCMAVAVPFTLYVHYSTGVAPLYPWANKAARMPFQMLEHEVDEMASVGALATAGQADGAEGLERLLHMRPSRRLLWHAGLGLVLLLLCGAARLRWTWWPIHPVMFMVWGSIVSSYYAASFLAGWVLKMAFVRFGSSATYRKARMAFIGMIAGAVVMGLAWMVVGAVYYACTGHAGPAIRVH